MRSRLVSVIATGLALGCNDLSGLSSLEKVDCVTDCGGGAGGGTDGGALTPVSPSVGRKTSCVIISDGTLRCWGANPGALPGTVSTKPVVVQGLQNVASLSVGLEHTCAVDSEGTVWCWGRNEHGQLGNGTTTPSPEPMAVPGLPVISTVTVGATHSCAYTSVDVQPVQAFCWGQNDHGQLGNGTTENSSTPITVSLPTGAQVVRMSPGSGYTAAIVEVGGTLETWAWGRNDKGQCGQSPSQPMIVSPQKVPNVPAFERVYPGVEHMCVRTVGTKLPWCWGANDSGQIGLNSTSVSEPPSEVIGAASIDTMHVGARHTCLLKQSTLEALCWGANDLGQFGDAPSVDQPLPVPATYLDGAPVSMRQAEHGCRLTAGLITCFGANDSGQLGNGAIAPSGGPTVVDLGL